MSLLFQARQLFYSLEDSLCIEDMKKCLLKISEKWVLGCVVSTGFTDKELFSFQAPKTITSSERICGK